MEVSNSRTDMAVPDSQDSDANQAQSRRRQHRRAKKSRKRHRTADPDLSKITKPNRSSRKHHQQIYLRPTNGPLVNAPKNSTQFIIDDHDSFSSLIGAELCNDDEYSERDFQSVYESAHQEEVLAWDRKRLCDEITSLERRQRTLVNLLARHDPEIRLRQLQGDLGAHQHTHRLLLRENTELKRQDDLPDSTKDEGQEDQRVPRDKSSISETASSQAIT